MAAGAGLVMDFRATKLSLSAESAPGGGWALGRSVSELRDCERAIRWDDPQLGITWPPLEGAAAADPLLSEKDAVAPLLAELSDPDLFN